MVLVIETVMFELSAEFLNPTVERLKAFRHHFAVFFVH
jgi:hypothetical protein